MEPEATGAAEDELSFVDRELGVLLTPSCGSYAT
jgi:hypothetical protein